MGGPQQPNLTSSAYETTSVGDSWGDNIQYLSRVTGFEVDNILGNNELKSELTEEIEVGVDLRFLNGLGLDVAYYTRKMTDAVLTLLWLSQQGTPMYD